MVLGEKKNIFFLKKNKMNYFYTVFSLYVRVVRIQASINIYSYWG